MLAAWQLGVAQGAIDLERHPLDPPDISSPRAALGTFIAETAAAIDAFPSQTLYLERSHGLDAALTKAAETEVARWRSENRLPFPDYDEATRRELSNNLDYPPEGSPGRPASR